MSDKIIVLKQTKLGLVKDTIVSANDTLLLNLKNEVQLVFPEEILQVNALEQPKTGFEIFGMWVGIILGLVTIGYTLYSIKKLLEKDDDKQKQLEDKQEQIDKLTLISESLVNNLKLNQKRFELYIKPKARVQITTDNSNATNSIVKLIITNSNQTASIVNYEPNTLSEVSIQKNSIAYLNGNQVIEINLSMDKSLDVFKLNIDYTVEGGYEYIHDLLLTKGSVNGNFSYNSESIINKGEVES